MQIIHTLGYLCPQGSSEAQGLQIQKQKQTDGGQTCNIMVSGASLCLDASIGEFGLPGTAGAWSGDRHPVVRRPAGAAGGDAATGPADCRAAVLKGGSKNETQSPKLLVLWPFEFSQA